MSRILNDSSVEMSEDHVPEPVRPEVDIKKLNLVSVLPAESKI